MKLTSIETMNKARLCAVSGCKYERKRQRGVTHHSPANPQQSQAWRKALGKRSTQPVTVCGSHFTRTDFVPGSRVLKTDAVPSVRLARRHEASTEDETSDREEEMSCNISEAMLMHDLPDPIETELVKEEATIALQACRICLSTHGRLYPMQKLSLAASFEQLTGLFQSDSLPSSLCALCATVLCKLQVLRARSERAHGILLEMMELNKLTLTEIQKVDRRHHQLTPNLDYRHVEPNHFDRHYVYDDHTVRGENAISDEVKMELEPLKCERVEDTGNCDESIDDINVLEAGDDCQIDISGDQSNSDDEQDVPIKQLIESRNAQKSKPKASKVVKEGKSKKVCSKIKKKQPKTVKLKSKDTTETLAEVKTKTTKAPKGDKETEKKMAEYFAVKVFTSLEEKLEEMQKRKLHSSYVNAPLKCEFCYQGFLDNVTYDVHMQKHSNKHGEFTCEVCQFRCPNKTRLRQHAYFRHSRKFSCRLCRFESHDKYRATLHMRFHEGKTYKCAHCDKVFNHQVNMHNHLRAKHPSDNVCALCGYSFLGVRGLATHMTLLHGHEREQVLSEDSPLCAECDIRFASEEALQMHLRVSSKHGKTHENLKKRNYHALHRSLKAKATKPKRDRDTTSIVRKRDGIRMEKRPIKLTTFDEPVPCEKCGVPIQSPSEYHYHFMRQHPHEKRAWFPTDTHPHLCELCGKMLRNNALKDHMLEHTEGITFKCDTCGKKFSKRFNMRLHSRVHLGERYPCQVCGKLFNHMGNRDRHVKYVHTESKDFKCEFCGKCFKNDGARRLHTNHVHLRKPYPKRNRNRDGNRPPDTRAKETDAAAFRTDCTELWE